jgi:WS/DGAT/MGAT family acyltransferase
MFGREAMDATDVAWLHMDSDTNLMMVTGVFLLADPVTLTTLRETTASRFLVFDRFRQRVVPQLSGASWERDPGFDIARHVVAVPPGTVRGKRGLQRLVGALAATPLDPDHPLWRMDLVPRYRGGSALIMRIHHCYADGIALIQVLLAMTDASADAEPSTSGPAATPSGSDQSLVMAFARPLEKAAEASLRMTRDLWVGSMHALRDPLGAVDLAAAGADTLGELAKTIAKPSDPRTRFTRKLSGVKRVAWAEPMPLADVKRLGKTLGCTINDILIACATGAFRGYLEARGDEVDGLEFRAEVPVNLRPEGEDFTRLGNRFGLVLLDLPVGIPNPFERLFEVRRRMNELKHSRQPIAAYLMLNAMGRLPAKVERPMLQFFTTKATTVMTNVPGPREPLYFAGAELSQLLFWVPQAGHVGIGVSILSYRGTVQIGVIADDNLLPDPDDVVGRFRPEFEALAAQVRMDSPRRK